MIRGFLRPVFLAGACLAALVSSWAAQPASEAANKWLTYPEAQQILSGKWPFEGTAKGSRVVLPLELAFGTVEGRLDAALLRDSENWTSRVLAQTAEKLMAQGCRVSLSVSLYRSGYAYLKQAKPEELECDQWSAFTTPLAMLTISPFAAEARIKWLRQAALGSGIPMSQWIINPSLIYENYMCCSPGLRARLIKEVGVDPVDLWLSYWARGWKIEDMPDTQVPYMKKTMALMDQWVTEAVIGGVKDLCQGAVPTLTFSGPAPVADPLVRKGLIGDPQKIVAGLAPAGLAIRLSGVLMAGADLDRALASLAGFTSTKSLTILWALGKSDDPVGSLPLSQKAFRSTEEFVVRPQKQK